MPLVPVAHSTGSYPVRIEPGALGHAPQLLEAAFPGRRLALITDAEVARQAPRWTGLLTSPAIHAVLVISPGEGSKTRESWVRLTDDLVRQGFGRDTAIVALGGGVVGDLAGFVAATFLRGVPFAQLPTTTVAMLDAAVGGKVGVDTDLGKNLVGAFWPPSLVLADPLTLATLPDRQYRSGLAEAVKHGVIADAGYFAWIERETTALLARAPGRLAELIRRSVEIKAAIVARDEHESGERAVLNAGHTVAHGIEAAAQFSVLHGEAVAAGLVAELRIGERLQITEPGVTARVARLLEALGLPVRWHTVADVKLEDVLEAMQRDKKNRGGNVQLALVEGLGRPHTAGGAWTTAVAETVLNSVLQERS